jgi:archaellum component FlaC
MASPYADLLKTLPGASVSTVTKNLNNDDNLENDVGTFKSIMAGVGSGLFKIPEGLFSLGATLIDLGADTNQAAEVEEYFAKINPFDEMAEATTAGKITELITNLAIPGGS